MLNTPSKAQESKLQCAVHMVPSAIVSAGHLSHNTAEASQAGSAKQFLPYSDNIYIHITFCSPRPLDCIHWPLAVGAAFATQTQKLVHLLLSLVDANNKKPRTRRRSLCICTNCKRTHQTYLCISNHIHPPQSAHLKAHHCWLRRLLVAAILSASETHARSVMQGLCQQVPVVSVHIHD